jgi:predicted nucleic acid-binding protein
MAQRLKIYLDTSVPSAYYDDRKPDRMEETRRFWEKLDAYEVIISGVVQIELEELHSIDPERAKKTLDLVVPFYVAPFSDQAAALSEVYMKAKVFRRRAERDARHAAIATVEQARYLVSWNYRDLVNIKTRAKITVVNLEQGYGPLEILTPPELTGGGQ